MCLEEMFSYTVEKAYIFYFENRRREEVLITKELRENARRIIEEMHSYMMRKYTPKVRLGKGCNSCSLKEACLPQLQEKKQTVSEYISEYIKAKKS